MKKVLIAWELGTAYGHVGTFPALAKSLRKQGCEVTFALNEFDTTSKFFTDLGFECLPAPAWKHYRGVVKPLRSYTEILARYGFLDADRLLPVIGAWRDLYERMNPDLVIANHAPTALFATAGLDLARVSYGTGFECPPKTAPFPPIAPWQEMSADDLCDTDARVLDTVNRICQQLGSACKEAVSDIMEVDAEFLCTFAELDPYHQHREYPEYWGPQTEIYMPRLQDWRPRRNSIFAYLQPYYSRLSETLESLLALDKETVVHCPGLPPDFAGKYVSRKLTFATSPIDTKMIVSNFGLVISHAGHGTTLALLLGGRPHFMLPLHLEHLMTAQAVAGLGAGSFVERDDDTLDIASAIATTLACDDFTDGAREFAGRYHSFDQAQQTDGITRRLLRLCE
ncbi:MAG: glycosyltransferase family 1 protein [Gammaproteobacteria bacterium]|nr:glycosyltransferase family 1 protein [Gammaproteobacteria bacterium]